MFRTISSVRRRLLTLVIVPSVFFCGFTGTLLTVHLNQKLLDQTAAYGEATLQLVSNHLAEYVIHEDPKALTVLVARMQAGGRMQSLEVYDIDNRLLAQAGRDLSGGHSFIRDLTYQDSTIGHVRLTLVTPRPAIFIAAMLPAIFFSGLALLLLGALIRLYGDFIYFWLVRDPPTGKQ